MTDQEVAGLKPGDKVFYLFRGKFVGCRVVEHFVTSFGEPRVELEHLERTPKGHRRENACAPYSKLSLMPNPLAANVYADWLDEQNEPRAAAKLRAAFPLDDGKETP